MRARRLLENASFGPEQLRVLYEAFDGAWEVVKSQYATGPQTIEVGRLRLADAILSAYQNGVTEPDALREAGVHLMQRWT